MLLNEVFVAGGLPTTTYVPRAALGLEKKLSDFLDAGHKLVTVTGPTKSGKTVLVRTVLKESTSVWVPGGSVGAESEFWDVLSEKLGATNSVEQTADESTDRELSGTTAAGLNVGVVKVDFGAGGAQTKSTGTSTTFARAVSSKVAALKRLGQTKPILVVDDFHYIEPEVQTRIVRALKDQVFDGLRVVLLAVPHRKFDAVRVEKEITGRVAHVDVPPWEPAELKEIADKGFPALNASVDDAFRDKMVSEALGSPHLMQDFCRAICKLHDITKRGALLLQLKTPADTDAFFRQLAADVGRLDFDRLANGPRTRTDRIQRELKDGSKKDIYHAVLRAIAAANSSKMEISYDQIREGLRTVLAGNIPQAHETTRVLEKMAEIAKKSEQGEPVLDWDAHLQKVVITDPFFAFYLRWGDYDD